jgi:hypothetical protein
MANRRKFLLTCSAAAVSSTFLPRNIFAAPSRFRTVATPGIGFETFAALVNTDFEVRDADGNGGTLELIEVTEWAPHSQNPNAEDAGNEKFSLLFRGLVTEELSQKIYWFEHSALGRFELYISQVGQKGPLVSQYEAIFNRPVAAAVGKTATPPRSSPRSGRTRSLKIK